MNKCDSEDTDLFDEAFASTLAGAVEVLACVLLLGGLFVWWLL